jgi:hypothetical protein
MRNVGGRITPGLLEQLGRLGRIGEVAGEIPGGGGSFTSSYFSISFALKNVLAANTSTALFIKAATSCLSSAPILSLRGVRRDILVDARA